MGLRTTLTLLVLVAALLAVLFFTKATPDDAGNVSVPVLGGASLENATRIRWRFHGQQPIEIRRAPGGPFRIVEPLEDVASLAHLRSIAHAYDRQMSEAPLPDDEATRARLGFDPPQLVVEVDFADGSSQRLEIGAEGALGTDLFVRRDGRIYRGDKVLVTALVLSLDDLRERRVFTLPPHLCSEFVIDRALDGGGREELRLQRTDAAGWRFASPIRARADTQATSQLLAQLLGLRVDVFPPAIHDFQRPPDLVASIRAGDADETVRLWRTDEGQLLGRIEPRNIWIALGPQQCEEIFQNAVDRLRSRVLVDVANVHTDLVDVIVDYGAGQPRLHLHRDSTSEAWSMQEPVVGPVQATPVQQLLTAVNNLRAVEFHDGTAEDARFGLRSDGLRIGVRAADQHKPAFVRLGADATSGELETTFAARAETMADVVSVPRGASDTIRRPWTDYVALQVVRLEQPVERVALQRGDGSASGGRRAFVLGANGWTVEGGDGAAREEMEEVVAELRDLRSKRVRLGRDAELGEPDWTLALQRANKDPFVELQVWERGDDAPLLVQLANGDRQLVHELGPRDSRMLRELWQ